MRKILFVMMCFVAMANGTFAQEENNDKDIVLTCIDREGVEMAGCYQIFQFSCYNPTDKLMQLSALDDPLCVFYTPVTNGRKGHILVGGCGEDIVLNPGETRYISIQVDHPTHKCKDGVIGRYAYDDSIIELSDLSFNVAEFRPWDLRATIKIEEINEEDGKKVFADVTFKNYEDQLYTPMNPFFDLYVKRASHPCYSYKFSNQYFVPGEEYIERVNLTGKVKPGITYIAKIGFPENRYNYDVGHTEEFTISTSDGINMVTTEDAPSVTYDLQGRRVGDMKQKGLYIVNGRKVVR